VRSLGYALGGAAAARLASRHGQSNSGDSVLRQLRRDGCAEPATSPVVVGIDDWAIKRGHRSGIVIVDLKSRRPIKVLEGRDGTVVAAWREQHPTVESVARDRAGALSEAARTASPRAQQVADRWHLLTSMRKAVERLLVRRSASLREAARTLSQALRIESQPITGDHLISGLRLSVWQRLGVHRRAASLARYEEIVRRRHRVQCSTLCGTSNRVLGRLASLQIRAMQKSIAVVCA